VLIDVDERELEDKFETFDENDVVFVPKKPLMLEQFPLMDENDEFCHGKKRVLKYFCDNCV
jgi:hypothetical protein